MDHTVAILGPKGTFSDVALLQEQPFPPPLPRYYPSIDAVFQAVGASSCAAGLVPIENTLDGYVQRTLDLLLEIPVQVVHELQIPIQFSLIANTNTQQEIKTLYVQFKASGQCRKVIATLQAQGVEVVLTQSNMASFEQIECHQQAGDAAIIPFHQRTQSSAAFCVPNVTDAEQNKTRFIRVVPSHSFYSTAVSPKNGATRIRIPLYFLPPSDRPGVLYELLSPLHAQEINLVSIISRPTKKNLGTYHFYLEVDGPLARKEAMLSLLSQMERTHPLKILGVYSV